MYACCSQFAQFESGPGGSLVLGAIVTRSEDARSYRGTSGGPLKRGSLGVVVEVGLSNQEAMHQRYKVSSVQHCRHMCACAGSRHLPVVLVVLHTCTCTAATWLAVRADARAATLEL